MKRIETCRKGTEVVKCDQYEPQQRHIEIHTQTPTHTHAHMYTQTRKKQPWGEAQASTSSFDGHDASRRNLHLLLCAQAILPLASPPSPSAALLTGTALQPWRVPKKREGEERRRAQRSPGITRAWMQFHQGTHQRRVNKRLATRRREPGAGKRPRTSAKARKQLLQR